MPSPLVAPLQAVVAIGFEITKHDPRYNGEIMHNTGTGLLYGYPTQGTSPEELNYRLWLVTCRHLVEEARGENANVMARLNLANVQRTIKFRIPSASYSDPRWYFHPIADVAVISAIWQDFEDKGIRWQTFAAHRNALNRERLANGEFFEGDKVFMIGFPVGWRPGRQDYPIVRHGVFAQLQGFLKGEHSTYLVDGSGFPGNSGGPIVTLTGSMSDRYQVPEMEHSLVGIVGKREFSPIDTEFADVNLPLEETADLVEVIPVDAIDETIVLAMEQEAAIDEEDVGGAESV